MFDKNDFQQYLQKIEHLTRVIETTADPNLRTNALEVVQLLMDLHGSAIKRMMDIISQSGVQKLINSLANDELISSILLLYSLHPIDIETRVKQALEKISPYFSSQNITVNLLGINQGVVKIELVGNYKGSSALSVKLAIEEAIYQVAPDIESIEILDLLEPQLNLVQLKKGASLVTSSSLGKNNGIS